MRIFKRFRRKSKAEIALHIFVSIIFFIVAASYVYILVWAVMAACKTHTEIIRFPFALPKEWYWEHFIEVFDKLEVRGNNFWMMLFNSCYFAVLGSFITHFSIMSFAYCCTKYKFPGSDLPYTIILFMMTLPLYGSSGAVYKIYYNLGMVDSYTHILTGITGMTSEFLYYRAFLKNLSWSYAEAAMMDGANHLDIYFRVMAPMMKPIFGALYLTAWLSSWNNYETAMIYLPNLPTLPVGIYQFNTEMIYRARLDIIFAACVLVTIPAIVLFTVFNKTLTTNITTGALKG